MVITDGYIQISTLCFFNTKSKDSSRDVRSSVSGFKELKIEAPIMSCSHFLKVPANYFKDLCQ